MAYTSIRFNTADAASTGAVLSDAQGTIIGPRRSGPLYPYTLGGITMGMLSSTGVALNFVNSTWDGSNPDPLLRDDARLQQGWRVPNNQTPQAIRLDLGVNTYRLILGLTGNGGQRCRWQVQNGVGGPPLYAPIEFNAATVWGTDSGVAIDRWCDQNLNSFPLGPNALSVATPEVVELTSGVLVVTNGGHSGGTLSSDLSFIAWEPVDPPTSGAVRMMYHLLA